VACPAGALDAFIGTLLEGDGGPLAGNVNGKASGVKGLVDRPSSLLMRDRTTGCRKGGAGARGRDGRTQREAADGGRGGAGGRRAADLARPPGGVAPRGPLGADPEELRIFGREGGSPSSACRLQSLYLDFGQTARVEHLLDSVLRALHVPREAAGLAASDPRLREAERQSFTGLDDEDATRLAQRAARLSRRGLMTVLVFNAHFWNVRLALEVVSGERPLEWAALGTCALVAERRTGRHPGRDLRYHTPGRERRPEFCFRPLSARHRPPSVRGPAVLPAAHGGRLRHARDPRGIPLLRFVPRRVEDFPPCLRPAFYSGRPGA